jgi:XTP/dITP diphosphohydrolase
MPGRTGFCAAVVRGTCEGHVGHAPCGAGGFGYDPLFVLPDRRTMAELPPAEKDRVSHRGAAAAMMVGFLRSYLGL